MLLRGYTFIQTPLVKENFNKLSKSEYILISNNFINQSI